MSTTVHTVDINQPDYQWSGVDRIELEDNTATAYVNGKHNTYIVRCKLPATVKASGVAASIYLGDWQHIDYVAIGYSQTLGFKHIKAKNIRQNAWVDMGFSHDDIIWQLQNGHQQTSDANIGDIKLFIKGDPGQAMVKLRNLQVVQTAPITTPPMVAVAPGVISVLTMHFRRALRDYNFAATEYMATGQCPMPGKQLLPWGIAAEKPETLSSVNSFCSAWHGMHLPIALMLYAEDTQTTAPLMAARVLIEQWLDNSYFQPDSDVKYTWYDHGTAERLLAFILLWHKCAEQGQDARFANRLWQAIDQHAELLNSEAFYAYHQPTRYHNHAWFQDTALIAAALAFPEQAQAEQWLTNGISRFEDQLEKLIVRDGGYAIFVENSIGYHHGVQKLAEVVGALVQLSGRDTEIPQVAQELTAWSDFLRYPDGRVPAQGDTFRLPPRTGNDIRRGKPWAKPGCTVLPKAGYAVVKGNHDNKPWMLCLFNTSLSETHKHEDNLSITFWFDGIEWLIDPSFYSHEYDQDIPEFLRSKFAHNRPFVVNAQKVNQSIIGAELIDDSIAGYFKVRSKVSYSSGIELTRSISISSDSSEFIFEDSGVDMTGGDITLCSNFHVSEIVEVCRLESTGIQLRSEESDYFLQLSFNADYGVDTCAGFAGLGFLEKDSTGLLDVKSIAGMSSFRLLIEKSEERRAGSVDLEVIDCEYDHKELEDISEDVFRLNASVVDMNWRKYLKNKAKTALQKIDEIINKSPSSILRSEEFGSTLREVQGCLSCFYKSGANEFELLESEISKFNNTKKSQIGLMLYALEKPDVTTVSYFKKKKKDTFDNDAIELLNCSSIEKVKWWSNIIDGKSNVQLGSTLVVDVPFIFITINDVKLIALSVQSPLDAIYYPEKKLLIVSDLLRFDVSARLPKLYGWMVKNLGVFSGLWGGRDDTTIKFLVRDKRPYHVLLDELSGWYELNEAGYDLKKLYFARSSFIEGSSVLEFDDASSHVFSDVIVTSHRRADKDAFSEKYFEYLKLEARELYGAASKSNERIVFWLSISGGEKRRWFEEKEALIEFIRWVCERFTNYHFYVDGWTSPQNLSEFDEQQISSHNEIWKHLCDVTGLDDTKFTSFVGASIFKKIWGVQQASMFISCAGTPSVWPSLIGRVPGVVHNSKSMIKRVSNTYFSDNVVRVPDEAITDVNEIGDKIRWDKFSYSIAVKAFMDCADQCLERIFPFKKPAEFYQELVRLGKAQNHTEAKMLEEYFQYKFRDYRNLKHVLKSSAFFGKPQVDILHDVEGCYRVIDCDNTVKSDIVFITFSRVTSNVDHIPFGYPFLNKMGYKHIHVAQAKRTSYQRLSMEEFYKLISPVVSDYKYRFTYGPSLGGYAALYYATCISAYAIAGSPRLPLHPENLKFQGVEWLPGGHWDETDFIHDDFSILDLEDFKGGLIIYDKLDLVDSNFVDKKIVPFFKMLSYLHVPNSKHGSLMALSKAGALKSTITDYVIKKVKYES